MAKQSEILEKKLEKMQKELSTAEHQKLTISEKIKNLKNQINSTKSSYISALLVENDVDIVDFKELVTGETKQKFDNN